MYQAFTILGEEDTMLLFLWYFILISSALCCAWRIAECTIDDREGIVLYIIFLILIIIAIGNSPALFCCK